MPTSVTVSSTTPNDKAFVRPLLLVSAMVLVGCINDSDNIDAESDAVSEIVQNLELAGYPASEIDVDDNGVVIVGGDAVVSLAASREMIGLEGHDDPGDDQFRQYRTINLVGNDIDVICVNGAAFTKTMSTALDIAIANYNALQLQFIFLRTSSPNAPGCDATITALAQGPTGGAAGFPSGGLPYSTFRVGKGTANYGGLPVVTHVIVHELGHCVGLRHSDYFDRSISCGGTASNEGAGGAGAIHIKGTPTGATDNGSVMNSCFNLGSTGVFTESDVKAFNNIY